MSMAWEPDRRSNFFFNPPAHLCAVTYMTEISLIVTLNNPISPHKNAGCRMIHISSFVKALKLTWIRRILQTNSSWVNLFNESTQCSIKSVCDFGNEYLRCRLKEIINPFWKDVLQSLCDFVTLLPKRNISAVLKSPLWHNCFI